MKIVTSRKLRHSALPSMNAFSEAVSEALFAAFPHWRPLARTESSEEGDSYLVVEVPALAEADVQRGLLILTSNEEITVGFDFYHSHFNGSISDGEAFGMEAALEFIQRVIAEEIAVVSWWLDEKLRGSAQIDAGASPATVTWGSLGAFNRIRVRSWRGSLNADIDV
jgi:hypothetical protein